MLAVEHEPGEVCLQRVPVLLQEALHVVRHRAGKMFDPAKKRAHLKIVFPAVLRIWDPGSGAFLSPGSRILDGKKSGSGNRDPGSRIRDDHTGLYFREFRLQVFGLKKLKYLNSLMQIWIWIWITESQF